MGHNTKRWAYRTYYWLGLNLAFDPAGIWQHDWRLPLYLAALACIMEYAQHAIMEETNG